MERSAILLLIPLFTCLIGIEGVPVVEEKIVGGELATRGEFPWQVSFRLSGRHRCGGTLVSLQHVLTAAHCVFDVDVSRVTVISGSNSLAQGGTTSLIRSVFIHPNYASVATSYHIHDVAVLILQMPLVETQFQRSIALAIEDPSEGSQAVVSGWGRLNADDEMIPAELQKLDVTIINATDCRDRWGPNIAIISGHLCGVQRVNNTGVCNGDSGSGLIWENQVVGIVSWANPCGLNYPDVYVRVYWYLSWIGSIVYNEEIETTLPPPTGGHVAISHGNFVLLILCLYALRTIIIL